MACLSHLLLCARKRKRMSSTHCFEKAPMEEIMPWFVLYCEVHIHFEWINRTMQMTFTHIRYGNLLQVAKISIAEWINIYFEFLSSTTRALIRFSMVVLTMRILHMVFMLLKWHCFAHKKLHSQTSNGNVWANRDSKWVLGREKKLEMQFNLRNCVTLFTR